LYLVKSTHEYKALDTDELTFGPGEELKVLETKPEDQVDEGWQLGEKSDGTRGVFPENFTKRIEKCA
uniref:SH3 domain-containing protein n=1 Tax=Angiostrongylus cantonensis TaxID=6313 RepID=A0A0K0DQT2_ANGCA